MRPSLPLILLLMAQVTHAARAADDSTAEDTSFSYKPSFALSSGYDSNPDEEEVGTPTGYNQGDLGLRLSYEKDTTEAELKIDGRHRQLWENDDPERWRYGLRLKGATGDIKEQRLDFLLEKTVDAIELPPVENETAALAFERAYGGFGMRLEGFAAREINDGGGDEDDHQRAGLRSEFKALPDAKLSPFLRASYAAIEFPNQDTSQINRNGHDLNATAGITWKPSSKLRIGAGGRFNVRFLEDDGIPRYSNGFIDLNVEWKALKNLTFTAEIDRKLDEPGSDTGVVEDQITYQVGVYWSPADDLDVEASGAFKQEEEIGADEFKDEWELAGKVSYDINDDFQVFTRAFWLWSRNEAPGEEPEEYDRLTVAAGIESTF